MFTNKRNIIIFAAILLSTSTLFWACHKEEEVIRHKKTATLNGVAATNHKIILGNKLVNAYSVDNMKIAYNNLKARNAVNAEIVTDFEINASHLYVRFLPTDSADTELLRNDTTLELFDYPLDYEMLQDGSYYHDPAIPDNKPTWQYTTVPVDYNFPDVQYEIIESCFIPDVDSEVAITQGTEYTDFLALLEFESMMRTENLTDAEKQQAIIEGLLPSKVHPEGDIKVWNTQTGTFEGIKRVKVRTQRLVKISTDWTDEEGHYLIPATYRYDVHYMVIFENLKGFKIWGNWAFFAPATYSMGWHSKHGCDWQFQQNSVAWKWATVNNAAYQYLKHCHTYGITLPPSDLRYWVFESEDSNGASGSAAMLRRTWGLFGFNTTSQYNTFFNNITGLNMTATLLGNSIKYILPDITITVPTDTVSTTDGVYNTVFHETAHASHWQKVGSEYWVKYINYIITYGSFDNPYGNGTGLNAGYCGVGEMWGNYIGALFERHEFGYGTSFADPWAWFNEQEDWYNPGFLKDVDNIPDITTSEICSCLTSSTNTINKMVNQLKTKTSYDSQVDSVYNKPDYTDWP